MRAAVVVLFAPAALDAMACGARTDIGDLSSLDHRPIDASALPGETTVPLVDARVPPVHGSVTPTDASVPDAAFVEAPTAFDDGPVDTMTADADASRDGSDTDTTDAPVWTPGPETAAVDGDRGGLFGRAVAISGHVAVVGAASGAAPKAQGGAAYVFAFDGMAWAQQAEVTASDEAADDGFGSSVGISGDTVVVGAPSKRIGANAPGVAYVFSSNGTTWVQQAELTAADGANDDGFGYSVGISGNTIVVGAPSKTQGANMPEGAVYVFSSSGGVWAQQAKLTGGQGTADDSFGYSVAISGTTVVVGALGTNMPQGAAFVFSPNGPTWTEQAELTAGDGADEGFGYSVAVSGETAVVGDPYKQIGAGYVQQGAAYVFSSNGTTWTEQVELNAADGARDDEFGASVGVSGNTLIAGAPFKSIGPNFHQGAAYVFSSKGTTWSEQAELVAGDGALDDEFGDSVAISGDTAIVGAYTRDLGATYAEGAAYLFAR